VENTLSWPLIHAARLHGERIATRGGPAPLTYHELARRVGALGAGLERLGVQRGDVSPCSPRLRRHLECWLAISAHGRILNDLNIRLAPPSSPTCSTTASRGSCSSMRRCRHRPRAARALPAAGAAGLPR